MLIFHSVSEAIRSGYQIESSIPDDNGFLRARTMTSAGWAVALVEMKRG